jgi:hypothetical protein
VDILNPIDSQSSQKREKISFEDKDLSSMTLPERARVLQEMLSLVEENEEMTEDEKQIAEKINLSVEERILAWAYIIKRIGEAQAIIENENNFYKAKIEENKNRIAVLQKRIDSRSSFLGEMMKSTKKKKVEGANFSVGFRKLPQKVELKKDLEEIDYSKYPGCFKEIPAKHEPIKAEMKKWLESNESDDFCLSDIEHKLEVK